MAAVSARKEAALERAMDWNVCQSCLSMKSSRVTTVFNTLAEVIATAIEELVSVVVAAAPAFEINSIWNVIIMRFATSVVLQNYFTTPTLAYDQLLLH
jgi:hypothetical protein